MGNDICTERTPDDMHLLGRRQGMDPRGASPGSCLVRGRRADLGSSHGGSRTVFFLFFFLIHFICFGRSGSLLLLGLFSSWGEGGLLCIHRLLVAEPRLSDLRA